MSWRNLLAGGAETITLPWTGGASLHSDSRTFKLGSRLREFGWYRFRIEGNTATSFESAEPVPEILRNPVTGYLVGDRIISDEARVDPDPATIVGHSERVHLIPEELDRFSRVRAGRIYPEGPLIFIEQAFPLGPEDEVMDVYLDGKKDVTGIPGVVPALDAAFRMETYRREQAELRRQEIARKRAEEEARKLQEQRRAELRERLGDGATRRVMAQENFAEAARAALQVGGAEYLDHRSVRRNEWAVKYRVDGQRLECVCDTNLHIIDAGVCLTDHATDESYDTRYTLESIPGVIREAVRTRRLVVWRHI
jgi:hypothetical protein